jgi:hypothetical protein
MITFVPERKSQSQLLSNRTQCAIKAQSTSPWIGLSYKRNEERHADQTEIEGAQSGKRAADLENWGA